MTEQRLIELPVFFYRTSSGNEPVREWLRSLPTPDRQQIGIDLATIQIGWPIGMPLCRSLGKGLWEIRSHLPSNRISRIMFCVHAGRIGILHGFIKKSSKTPHADLELAYNRLKEMTT